MLSSKPCSSAKLVLSPTAANLDQSSFQLNSLRPCVTMGSQGDLILKGPLISRCHAQLELEPEKGALYILDTSTNGTFLNGQRLPKSGKVAIFHGDELVFPDPKGKIDDFGFMVNLELT